MIVALAAVAVLIVAGVTLLIIKAGLHWELPEGINRER